ncbi:unnamed protein product, partial [Brassica rapa subsp. narinosa]
YRDCCLVVISRKFLSLSGKVSEERKIKTERKRKRAKIPRQQKRLRTLESTSQLVIPYTGHALPRGRIFSANAR